MNANLTTPRNLPTLHKNTRLPIHKNVMTSAKLYDLVQQIDYNEELTAEAEELLLLLSNEFVESVLEFSCQLAVHRNSDRLEPRDVLLHLNKHWGIHLDEYFCHPSNPPSIVTNTFGDILPTDGTVKWKGESHLYTYDGSEGSSTGPVVNGSNGTISDYGGGVISSSNDLTGGTTGSNQILPRRSDVCQTMSNLDTSKDDGHQMDDLNSSQLHHTKKNEFGKRLAAESTDSTSKKIKTGEFVSQGLTSVVALPRQ
eukprot:TRINITY_DN4737_c0_g1_i4.p1 TRINITY_DN4737_c0_g1~~TRINITY_DN4737_c0_g1_i4.p1  ORF type:complete len:255 (+),score=42.41 TRINITY_DN4737_c0_g1_i4:133-897(+)